MNVEHEPSENRFVVRLGDDVAELVYALVGPRLIDLQHTYVPDRARGHGVAEALAKAALAYAREKNLRVVPTCPFVRRWLATHPDEGTLVDSRYASR